MFEDGFDSPQALSLTLAPTEALIDGEVRGVPDSVFLTGDAVREGVKSSSGKSEFFITVRPDVVDLTDMNDADFVFHAEVWNGVLSLLIRTQKLDKDGTVQKHPDLFAKRLVLRSLDFFKEQGVEVNEMEFNWVPHPGLNDNLRAFGEELLYRLGKDDSLVDKDGFVRQELLEQLVSEAGKEDIEYAVKSTWSGRLAAELGFTELVIMSEDGKTGFLKQNLADGSISVHMKKMI